ncbi:MAG: dienelactone hydrolase family protein [Verrucomicrobiota bacterium]|nr:dienelactone hydrolase family protein [Verrucomicrobiota bacterium]
MKHYAIAALTAIACLSGSTAATADGQDEVTRPEISAQSCPVEVIEASTRDKQTASAVVRKPPGKGPFPAIVFLHGGLNQRNVDRVKREAPNQPTNSRFLAAGYVTAEAVFRTRSEDPQSKGPLMDYLAIIEQVKKMPEVDPGSIVVLGHSGGGNLALELAGETELCAVVAGEPASIIFTGMYNKSTRRRDQRDKMMADPKSFYTPELQKLTREKIGRIACPVLIVHGDQHPINKINHEIVIPETKQAGKKLEVILYPGQPHTFVFGQDGSPEAARKCFKDCDSFFNQYLPTKPTPLEESLVKQVPAAEAAKRQRRDRRSGEATGTPQPR